MKFSLAALLLFTIFSSGLPAVYAQRTSARLDIKSRSPIIPIQNDPLHTGQRTQTPALTKFENAASYSDGNGAWIVWRMEVETGNTGFIVYKLDAGEMVPVTTTVIGGSAFKARNHPFYGEIYTHYDESGSHGSVYIVEALGLNGDKIYSKQFGTGYVADYKAVPELSAANLTGSRPKVFKSEINDSAPTLTKEVMREMADHALVPDLDNHLWVLSNSGVRIGAKTEGLVRVNRAQLLEAGFDVDSDHDQWQLYLEGVEQSIIVEPSGEYIEFFSKELNIPESKERMYYLINGPSAGKRISSGFSRPPTRTVLSTNYDQTHTFKERSVYINSIMNGEAENFWGRPVVASGTTINFNLSGIDTSIENATVELRMQGFSATAHSVNIILNGHTLSPAVGSGATPFSLSQSIPVSHLINGSNTLQLASGGPQGDTSLFDQINITFSRKHLAVQGKLEFVTLNNHNVTVEGFTSEDVRLFDVTREGNAVLMTGVPVINEGGGYVMRVPAARSRKYYAVEHNAGNNGLQTASSINAFSNESLRNTSLAADLIIVSHKAFMADSENWANYRRGQGFNVKVIDVDSIYDQFASGIMRPSALKSFFNYAQNNWATSPQYILLMGDATYDPREYLNHGFLNFVPSKIINTIFSETGSDEYLVDFNNDGLAEVSIGRIPARNSTMIATAFTKTQTWETNLSENPFSRGALFAYDHPVGWNFQLMSEGLRDLLPSGTTATMVGRDSPTAQADIISTINNGPYIVNFSGHGTATAWAAANFFWTTNVPSLTNAGNESLFTMLTCLNGYFLHPTTVSLGESLLFAQNGGSVVSWASTGLTTPDIQEIMARRFYQKISEGEIERLGPLVIDSKTVIPGGVDVRLSWALLGDPMLKVR